MQGIVALPCCAIASAVAENHQPLHRHVPIDYPISGWAFVDHRLPNRNVFCFPQRCKRTLDLEGLEGGVDDACARFVGLTHAMFEEDMACRGESSNPVGIIGDVPQSKGEA